MIKNRFDKVKEIANVIADSLSDFLDKKLTPEMKLDELAKIYSEDLDKIIIGETSLKSNYIGGTFYIKYIDDNNFYVEYEMYFQTPKKEWIKKRASSEPQSSKYIEKKEFMHLAKVKEVKYDIEPPVKEVKYDIEPPVKEVKYDIEPPVIEEK